MDKVKVPVGRKGDWEVTRMAVKFLGSGDDSLAIRMGDIPIGPGVYTRLLYWQGDNFLNVMSDTPAEMADHEAFTRIATGDVLITGLGLGMCIQELLKKPDVKSITVIEKNPDVFYLVAPTYQGEERVKIILADALEWVPEPGWRFDYVWHDIWPDISEENLESMELLKNKYASFSGVQMCWAEKDCQEAEDWQKSFMTCGECFYFSEMQE